MGAKIVPLLRELCDNCARFSLLGCFSNMFHVILVVSMAPGALRGRGVIRKCAW